MAYNPAYPPTVPSNLRDNNTVMQNQHPQDHVQIANALNSLIGIVGTDPFANAVSGITSLQQRLSGVGKYATVYVAARNASAADKAAAGFVCDGINDDSYYINRAIGGLSYFLAVNGYDFGGIVMLSEGDFTLGNLPNAVTIDFRTSTHPLLLQGKGPGVTIVTRTGDRPMITLGGNRTGGTTTTAFSQEVSGISFHGGTSSQPGIQMYYNTRSRIRECSFFDFVGSAIEVVDGFQLKLDHLHLERCGSRTGGNAFFTNAAIHFWDSKTGATAGEYGSATSGSSEIYLNDLTFVDHSDGGIWFVAPGGSVHSKIFANNLCMQSNTVGGPSLLINSVKWFNGSNVQIQEGSGYVGGATAPVDYVSIAASTGVNITNFNGISNALTTAGSSIVKSFIAMRGGNAGVCLSNLNFEIATASFPSTTNNYPTVACIDYSGVNTACQVDSAAIVVDASGGAASVPLKNRSAATSTKRLANAGTAAISAASTTVTVAHLLNTTPAQAQIQVTPANSLGAAQKFWVDTITSTGFNVNVDQVPGGTGALFSWAVDTRLPRGTGSDI